MKKLILYISISAASLIAITVISFLPEIKRINKYTPDIIVDVAHLMTPIDWHEYERQHPPRRRH